jgi:acyl carrier protein
VDTEQLLRECIVAVCDVPPESVRGDTELDSLGVDSLASAEVIFELEIRTGRELPNHVLRKVVGLRTVGAVAAELDAVLASPSGPGGS